MSNPALLARLTSDMPFHHYRNRGTLASKFNVPSTYNNEIHLPLCSPIQVAKAFEALVQTISVALEALPR